MPLTPKVTLQDYYDFTPPADNAAGDVWSGLPTHGLLGGTSTRGIVITPACDLSNRKVETITYLPVIPVRAYFATAAFLPDLQREIDGQLQLLKLDGLVRCPDRFLAPDPGTLQAARGKLEDFAKRPNLSSKERNSTARILAGIELLAHVRANPATPAPAEAIRLLFGTGLPKILKNVVTNSLRLDVHFLPSDGQRADWSGVLEHSLALFRYALSAPVPIFDLAQDVQQTEWTAATTRLEPACPGAQAFADERPMKRVKLKPRFLADLLTRYVAMHVRLGSPDFTADTVDAYVNELGGGTA